MPWDELQLHTWKFLKNFGEAWMAKWIVTTNGYMLMITDCSNIWGEDRSTNYIKEKCEDWTSCLEGDPEEIAKTILDELKDSDNINYCLEDCESRLNIYLNGSLEDLSYSWTFTLNRLAKDMTNLLLEEELKRKNRQLLELAPQKASSSALQGGKRTKRLKDAMQCFTKKAREDCVAFLLEVHSSQWNSVLTFLSSEDYSENKEQEILPARSRRHAKKVSKGVMLEDEERTEVDKLQEEKIKTNLQTIVFDCQRKTGTKKKKKITI